MEIKLDSMNIKNFKGLEHYNFVVNGENVTVKADNKKGKTSLTDAFHWVLFGKDACDKQEFGIRPTDAKGDIIEGLEPEVECKLDVDGKKFTFKRILKPVASGTTTHYFFNDVRCDTKREYDEKVTSIIEAETFKLLTNPTYFLDLHWEKQREVLMEHWCAVSDDDVIKTNVDLAVMPEILGEHSLKEKEKWLKDRLKELEKIKKNIPARIKEQQLILANAPETDQEKINTQLKELGKQKDELEKELGRISNGTETVEKSRQITELDTEILKLQNKFTEQWQSKLKEQKKCLADSLTKVAGFQRKIDSLNSKIEIETVALKQLNDSMDVMRNQWHEVNNKTFEYHDSDVCPYCKSKIPKTRLKELHQDALTEFNLSKAQELEFTQKKGKEYKAIATQKETEVAKLEKEVSTLQAKVDAENKNIELHELEIKKTADILETGCNTEEIESKREQIASLMVEIAKLRLDIEPAMAEYNEQIAVLEADIDNLKDNLAQAKLCHESKKRIKELSLEEKMLAQEIEALEEQLNTIEEFVAAKVMLAEKQVNNAFKYVEWRLFETQANGKTAESCRAMVNGVAYQRGLNTEGVINAGLDIINAFADKLGVYAPIFVDNAESTTNFIEVRSQMIKLFKPEIRTKADAKKYSNLVLEFEERKENKEAS